MSISNNDKKEASVDTQLRQSLEVISSIEARLQLLVEDLTNAGASMQYDENKASVVKVDQRTAQTGADQALCDIEYWFNTHIKAQGMKFPVDLMQRLVVLLLRQCSTKGLNSPASDTARKAFDVLYCFLEDNSTALRCFGEIDTADVKAKLSLHQHLAVDPTNTTRFLLLLATNVKKWKEWQVLVSEHAQNKFTSIVNDYTEPSRISVSEDELPPKACYFELRAERVLEMFRTSVATGLTDQEAEIRRGQYGPNKLPEPKKASIFMLFLGQFKDFIVLVLLAASILSFILNEINSAIVLLVVIVINATIGFVQEVQAERALSSLGSLVVPVATVIRGGKQKEISPELLVPGDIVVLDEGQMVPADLHLVECAQLNIVEAVLTGESEPILKQSTPIRCKTRPSLGDRKNQAYMSSLVTKGRGFGVVTNTGVTTEVGKISSMVFSATTIRTPLQVKLAWLGKVLVAVAICACAVIVGIGLAQKQLSTLEVVHTGISLAVSVIPEGLVTVVVLTMSLGMKHMAAKKAIVRKLSSVEALGSVTTVCSDKTGTLTEGKMKMEALELLDSYCGFYGGAHEPDEGYLIRGVSPNPCSGDTDQHAEEKLVDLPSSLEWAMMVLSVCNNAVLEQGEDGKWSLMGDSTELALAIGAKRAGRTLPHYSPFGKRVHENAFDSDRKRMSVVFELTQGDSAVFKGLQLPQNTTHILLVKGAAEMILAASDAILMPTDTPVTDGACLKVEPLDSLHEAQATRQGEALADRGMRVLGFGVKFLTELPDETTPLGSLESHLVFIGVAGLRDPPRQGVPEAVGQCKKAGIRVCMITGDHRATATAISRQIGIFIEGDVSIPGDILSTLSEEKLSELNPFPVVFSRVTAADKMKIVKSLQRRGEIVAMTGDGVNDAAAIKQANVGIAMGIAGTEITRQASDIILADDNFATIVHAVREGRHIFDNIIKFIVYLLSCNSSEMWYMFLALVINLPVPLLAMQILWANIVADIPPSLALGVEGMEVDIMSRLPRNSKKGVFFSCSWVVHLDQRAGDGCCFFGCLHVRFGEGQAWLPVVAAEPACGT